jgi:hypothetical protein
VLHGILYIVLIEKPPSSLTNISEPSRKLLNKEGILRPFAVLGPTKDLFTPHPTIPDAWKYFARLDDTIVLFNGEQAVRDNKAVEEAIIVGSGKPQLGLMIIPSQNLPKSEVLKYVWPAIEKANETSPSYAQLSPDMVQILPAGTE